MGTTARLLLVDDEQSIIETLQAVLEQEGYQVRTAPTVAAARALLAAESFDVAVLDLRLDDGDGTELLTEVCAQQPATAPPSCSPATPPWTPPSAPSGAAPTTT